MTKPELLPCPFDPNFAGCCTESTGPPEVMRKWVDGTSMFYVYCPCGTRGPLSPTKDYAIEAWKRRAHSAAVGEVIETARELCYDLEDFDSGTLAGLTLGVRAALAKLDHQEPEL